MHSNKIVVYRVYQFVIKLPLCIVAHLCNPVLVNACSIAVLGVLFDLASKKIFSQDLRFHSCTVTLIDQLLIRAISNLQLVLFFNNIYIYTSVIN